MQCQYEIKYVREKRIASVTFEVLTRNFGLQHH